MSRIFQLATGIALLPLFACAQGARPDATDPTSAVITPSYDSAFAGYRPMQEDGEPSIKQWRALNDEVARVGGHAGAIKDDDSASSPPSERSEPKPPAKTPHQQH